MNKERLKEYGKRILIVIGVFLGVTVLFAGMAAAVLGIVAWQQQRDTPFNRHAAVEQARIWGHLAPLPVAQEALSFKVHGKPWQRQTELSFEAAPENVQDWVERSPGLSGLPRPHGAKGESSALLHEDGGQGSCKVTWGKGGRRIVLLLSGS
jgi:hypothetical protein